MREFSVGADKYAGGQHRGVDIALGESAAVVAPVAGEVTFAGQVPTHGQTITITTGDGHKGSLTHLGPLQVRRGAHVAEGDVIAAAGPSGEPEHSLPYVHLGVRVGNDDTYVDPLSLLPPRVAPNPPPAPAAPPAPAPEPAPAPTPPPAAAAPPAPPAPAPPPAAAAPVAVASPVATPEPVPSSAAESAVAVPPAPAPASSRTPGSAGKQAVEPSYGHGAAQTPKSAAQARERSSTGAVPVRLANQATSSMPALRASRAGTRGIGPPESTVQAGSSAAVALQ